MFVGHERSYRGKTHRQCILCSVVVYCHLFLLNKKLTESLLRKGLNCLTPLYTCQTQGPRMNNKCISGPPMIWVANSLQVTASIANVLHAKKGSALPHTHTTLIPDPHTRRSQPVCCIIPSHVALTESSIGPKV